MLDLLSIVFLGAVAACLVFFALVAAVAILMSAASRSFAIPPRPPVLSDEDLLGAVRYEQAKARARELARELDGGAVEIARELAPDRRELAPDRFRAANEAWKAPCKPCEALRRAGKAVARRIGILR